MVAESPTNTVSVLPDMKTYQQAVAPFAKADFRTAWGQLVPTLLLYALGWAAMAVSLRSGSPGLALLAAIPTAGFYIRLFIFFHDCGHNSFFPSTRWNRAVGFWLGVLVFTPGEHWWRAHAIHHATSSNLDKRGTGDVDTLTVAEYRALSRWGRLGYRLFRNPLVMFGLGPVWMFLIRHRFPIPSFGRKENRSVLYTNLAIIGLAAVLSLLIGFEVYLAIQLLMTCLAGMVGIWMFYVQHQFETSYWAHDPEWSYLRASFEGASYYRLPRLLQWFTGSIGFHHIHHFSPLVPNYRLEQAYRSSPLLRQATTITLRESLHLPRLALIDESHGCRMISFRQAEELTS